MRQSYTPVEIALMIGFSLAMIAFATDVFFDHTMRYAAYLFAAAFLLSGLEALLVNARQIRTLQVKTQYLHWHQRPALLIGIVMLFNAFYWFVSPLVRIVFSASIANMIIIPIQFLSIIPFFLFIRAGFYWLKRRRE